MLARVPRLVLRAEDSSPCCMVEVVMLSTWIDTIRGFLEA